MYIDHPGIAAKDPQALTQWYIDTLGMKLLRQAGPTTFFIGFDKGACIEIYAAKSDAEPIANNYVQGMTHIAFYTEDFEATRQMLLDNGIRFNETPGASFQDTSFNFKVWVCAQRVRLMEECFLHYRQDNEASSVNNPGKVYCICDEYEEIERFLKKQKS